MKKFLIAGIFLLFSFFLISCSTPLGMMVESGIWNATEIMSGRGLDPVMTGYGAAGTVIKAMDFLGRKQVKKREKVNE